MIVPSVPARSIERNNHVVERVDACKVRPFFQIAPMAGKRQIVRLIRAPMLPGDDMFNMMREAAVFLSKQTIFTTSSCTAPDQFPRFGWRHL